MLNLIVRHADTKRIVFAMEVETLDSFTLPEGCETVPVPDGMTATKWMIEQFDRQGKACRHHEYHAGPAPVPSHLPEVIAELWADARAARDARLAKTDWTQNPDVLPATRARWRAYRQALRDVPQTSADPRAIAWPSPPRAEG